MRITGLLPVLPLLLHVSCAGGRLSGSAYEENRSVAVMCYMDASPEVRFSPTSLDSFPDLKAAGSQEDVAAAIGKKMEENIAPIELAEFMRASFSSLLETTGQFAVIPPAEIATAMGSYLVVEEEKVRDYGKLRPTGASAVFELTIREFGVTDAGAPARPGYFINVSAKMISVADGEVIWEKDVKHDGSENGTYPANLPGLCADEGNVFRSEFGELLDRTAQVVFSSLGLQAR